VRLSAPRRSRAEPRARVVLCQGMLKAAKLEWVLQKGTELGVSAFVPLSCERAARGLEELGGAKRARWRRILEEATEQCGRARVPELAEPRTLPEALAALPAGAVALIPWEEERSTPLREALVDALERDAGPAGGPARRRPQAPEVHLFIGPEGGFAPSEVALAQRHGATPVTLGPRILRAETAAIVALALVMDVCGELVCAEETGDDA
jgi:16S rRNA (uracil1498-N3)-methyltransferase